MIDQDFEKWKKGKIVKQCPHCKFWTEKNEGCNHMTCVECKYQWCWLCLGKYESGHYTRGCCNGLQFYKETDPVKIKERLEQNLKNAQFNINRNNDNNRLGLNNNNVRNREHILLEMIYKFGFFFLYIFIMPYMYSAKKFDDLSYTIRDNCLASFFFYISFGFHFIFMGLPTIIIMSIIGFPSLFIGKYKEKVVDNLFRIVRD